MNKTILGIIALLIIVIGGWFLLGSSNEVDETGPIKVGVSLPLSGEAASYGEWMKAGLDLALLEINEDGGIEGRKVELVYEDDGCNADGVAALTKLINVDKVDAIIGPLCSAAAGPALPIAQAAKVPTIFWGSAPSLPLVGDYVFRTYPSDAFQGKFAADYTYNVLGKRKAAIVYVKNDWGEGLRSTFSQRFVELGGEIVIEEGVGQNSTDTRTSITKVKASDPDIIYVPLYPAGLAYTLRDISSLDIQATVFGGDTTEGPEILAMPESEGVYFSFASVGNSDEFKAKLQDKLGVESGPWTPIAYDSLKILAVAIESAGTNKADLQKALEKINFKEGVSFPEISFDSDGDLATPVFEVKLISAGEASVVE